MQNRYEHRNRRKYNLKVHIVLVTKYRKALLRHGIDDFVKRARLRKGKAAPPTLQEEWVSAATVNYEYWYFSYQNLFRLEPDVKSWRKKLDEDYDILDIMVFAEFSSNQRLQNQITPLHNITNTIIETHQQTRTRKKDMTDFIMQDYIHTTSEVFLFRDGRRSHHEFTGKAQGCFSAYGSQTL